MYNQRVGGLTPPSASALRQGILYTCISLDPCVVNGYLAGIYSLKCFEQRQWLQGLKPGNNLSASGGILR